MWQKKMLADLIKHLPLSEQHDIAEAAEELREVLRSRSRVGKLALAIVAAELLREDNGESTNSKTQA